MPLLDAALDAHGGAAVFAATGQLRAQARVGGLAWPLKGRSRMELEVVVDCHEPRAVFEDFPVPGCRGVMTAAGSRIEDTGGAVLGERAVPQYGALRGMAWRWDDLALMWFAGYAIWNYLTTPFLLARDDVTTRELPGRRLEASFAAHLPTHCPVQVFHFDDQGRLIRLDYTALAISRLAIAAHVVCEHRVFDGLLHPTRRRVTPRVAGRSAPGPTLVWIAIDGVQGVTAQGSGSIANVRHSSETST